MKKLLHTCAYSLLLAFGTAAYALGPYTGDMDVNKTSSEDQPRDGQAQGQAGTDGKGGASDNQADRGEANGNDPVDGSDGGSTATQDASSSDTDSAEDSDAQDDGKVHPKEP